MNWYGPDGSLITVQEANSLLGDDLARRITHTTLITDKGRITVSTVFLVLDHSHGGSVAVLWETMVFDGPMDQHCDRYTSREAAVAGHADTVTQVKTALDVDGVALVAEETFDGTVA
jgi:hypothetical protein